MHFSDDDLRSALGRKMPSPDFAQKVMARIEQRAREAATVPDPPHGFWQRSLGWGVSGALAACLLISMLARYESYRETQVEGQRAKKQAVLALQLSANKMGHVFRQAAKSVPVTHTSEHKERL